MSFLLHFVYAISFHIYYIEGFLNIEELQEMRYSLDISQNPINLAEADFSEGFELASKHGQKYFCKLPTKALEMEQQQVNEEKLPANYPIPNLLEPLKMQPCLKIVKGWWTYEFCYMKLLHQYHSEDGKSVGDTIDLGNYNSDFDWTNEQSIREKMFKKKSIQKYHTQYYVNGTECKVLNHKRDTEVRFYCDENAVVPYIERIDEPSTCSYIITVKTNLICSHPNTRITSKSKPIEILCQPILPPESFRSYFDQKTKTELAAYEEANLVLRRKRDQLRELLLNLKTKTQSNSEEINPTPSEANDKDLDVEKQKEIEKEKVLDDEEKFDLKEIAIGFLQRFVPEKKFIEFQPKVQSELLDFTINLVARFRKTLPSADLARLVRFEVLSFIERKDSLSEDFIAKFLRGISPTGDVKHIHKGSIQIKVRQINGGVVGDDDLSQQDPAIKELEQEIQSELDEAGVTSRRTIEVHLITTDGKKDGKLAESDIDRFKEALLEVMAGGAVEEREKEKFNRLLNNYNLLYKDAEAQFVLNRNKDNDDETRS